MSPRSRRARLGTRCTKPRQMIGPIIPFPPITRLGSLPLVNCVRYTLVKLLRRMVCPDRGRCPVKNTSLDDKRRRIAGDDASRERAHPSWDDGLSYRGSGNPFSATPSDDSTLPATRRRGSSRACLPPGGRRPRRSGSRQRRALRQSLRRDGAHPRGVSPRFGAGGGGNSSRSDRGYRRSTRGDRGRFRRGDCSAGRRGNQAEQLWLFRHHLG